MIPDVPAVSPGCLMREALMTMRRLGVHHLVVLDDGRIVGVISDRDTGGADARVCDTMSEPAITASPTMTVQEAADLMAENDVGCLPVIQDGRPVGVVDARDLLHALSRGVS